MIPALSPKSLFPLIEDPKAATRPKERPTISTFNVRDLELKLKNEMSLIPLMNSDEYDSLLEKFKNKFKQHSNLNEKEFEEATHYYALNFFIMDENCNLIRHIVNKTGPSILDYTDIFSRIIAIFPVSTPSTLIDVGVNINIMFLLYSSSVSALAEVPNEYYKASLLRKLILNGGVAFEPLSSMAQERVNDVMYQLFRKCSLLMLAKQDVGSSFESFPFEVIDLLLPIQLDLYRKEQLQ